MTAQILNLALRRNLITARREHERSMNMSVLTDAEGHKVAQRLYHKYISTDDYSKLPAFTQRLDALLEHFGAGKGNKNAGHDREPGNDGKTKNNKPDKSSGADKF